VPAPEAPIFSFSPGLSFQSLLAVMQKFSVTCFGTGDGSPCADCNHAAFLYRFGKQTILLDCGEPVDRSYKASGLSYDAIDSIFISHLHSDHVGGFFMLMQGFWLERRRKDLSVYLPGYAIKPLREMLRAALIYDELLQFRLRLIPLREKTPVPVGGLRVTPFRTSHLDRLRKRFHKQHSADIASYCFLLECGCRRVGHSADLGKPEDLEPLLAKPLDLLVCELAHFAPEQLFSYLRGSAIKRVAFVHLLRPLRERLAQTRRLAAKMLPDVPHTFPYDLAQIRL
jgi:ribonuclease BN (tRNA processing enzyme)